MSLEINEKRINVIVKPSSPKSEMLGFDVNRKAYRINIKAPPDKGKANIELVKFLSKTLKKKVRIVSGLSSKEKIVELE